MGPSCARLWSRIGAGDDEVLTWVPREDEARARPPGFHSLQGGLVVEAIAKLDPKVERRVRARQRGHLLRALGRVA